MSKKKTGPSINKGNSNQAVGTPWNFLHAVERRFGNMTFDLAASVMNFKAPNWFDEETDSLKQDWHKLDGNLWLNPPYANIAPWARKCNVSFQTGKRKIFLLVPASVGSNWFRDHVHNQCLVLFIQPRLVFEGSKDPYPKDLILCCYGLETFKQGYECWKWDA